ncbi:MAG: hypothetical protein ACUVXG_13150 [Anaerolineae bacterium]
MVVDAQFLSDLIERDDPLEVIWTQMERRCGVSQTTEVAADLRSVMDSRESALNELERAVYSGFFEVYDLLLERSVAQDAGYVFSLFDQCPFVILADSLSVREAMLLESAWRPKGWTVQRQGFAVAPFPPLTESLSQLLLGTPGPATGRDRPQFAYRYVAGPEHIPAMPPSGSLLVWMRLPDTVLEQVTAAQSRTVAEAYQSTVTTLTAVLEASGREAALVTSDHGYLYARSPTHYWPMPSRAEEAARSALLRSSRVRPLQDERARALRDRDLPHAEQRFFAFGPEHAAVRGRYWWGSASPNDRCTAHGGLSFVECLVPVLKVWRGKGGTDR